jgi:hypothetical protein
MPISRMLRFALALVGFVLLVVTIAVVGVLHFDPLCGEELGVEKTSPDGLYVAQFMIRNCGATTSYVGHINLRESSSAFHPDFLGDTISDGQVFSSSKYSGTRFCWSKPHKLSIGYPKLPVRSWGDVSIDNDFRNLECQ